MVNATQLTLRNLRSEFMEYFSDLRLHSCGPIPDNKIGAPYSYSASTVSTYGDSCSDDLSCEVGFNCRSTEHRTLCLCDENKYKLTVTNVKIWSSTTLGTSNAQYSIQAGKLDAVTASSTGGPVVNLPSRAQFLFSITVSLKDEYVDLVGPTYYLNAST
ncbi:hypothetical protein Btru_029312, partial [Bulinus truncatus]